MYQQTEAIYLALFEEVTAAKALLEQVSLVSQGREDLNTRIITAIRRYVEEDLRQLQEDPAELLSSRPMDDPLGKNRNLFLSLSLSPSLSLSLI